MTGDYGMEDYQQYYQETHIWDTNWKVLTENFIKSYHLPACHFATVGWPVDLEKMEYPVNPPNFNYHTILKDPEFKLVCRAP